MNGDKLLEKMELAEPAYVEAADAAQNKKRKTWRIWGAAAACLCAATVMSFFALRSGGEPTTQVGGLARPYGSNVVLAGESAIEWPWEYKTPGEQYRTLHMNGAEYGGGGRTMDEGWLDQALGTFELSGVDAYTGEEHRLSAEVYAIRGVSSSRRVAVKLGEACYGYSGQNDAPATLGALLDEYGLPDTLPLQKFGAYENRREQGYYSLPDDGPIWDVLEGCRDAENVHTDGWWPGEVPYLSFTATSEALGAYKQVVYVTEDGYFASNVFHGCRYFIGENAAGKILAYAEENGTAIPREPYLNSVAGTVTAITEDWILVDDSILCRDSKDGMTFRISLQDLRIRRCVEFGNIEEGDLVVVRFTGDVDTTAENTVDGARELAEGHLYNGNVAVPE